MRATFVDTKLQEAFWRDGYVTIPFLDRHEVDELHDIHRRLHQESGFGFQPSLFSADQDYKLKADQEIRRVCMPAVDRYFDGHHAYLGCFVVKEPGPEGEVGVHQDWTFVDERSYASLNAWFPLIDTDQRNGALCVMSGSHRLVTTLRGSPQFPSAFEGLESRIASNYGTTIPVAAGEAVVYSHALLHWSRPNQSQTTRTAVALSLSPSEATLSHFFRHGDGRIEAFEVDNAFFTRFKVGEVPTGVKSLGSVDFTVQRVTRERLDAHYRAI